MDEPPPPPPPPAVIEAIIELVAFELGVLDTVLILFDAVCIFDTDEEADVEGDLILERESITVIDFTDDAETLLISESVPAAPSFTPLCVLLIDIVPEDVIEFVWLTDTDSDGEIVVLELIVTLTVEAELRELNRAVDDKRLVGLFNMLAEEVNVALTVAAGVRLAVPVKEIKLDLVEEPDGVNDENKLNVDAIVKVIDPVGDPVAKAEYVDDGVIFADGLVVDELLRLFSADLDGLGLELDDLEGEGLTEGECVPDEDDESEEVVVTVDVSVINVAVFFVETVPVTVEDAERERVGDVVAELVRDDNRFDPVIVTVALGDPVCDSVADPESDICDDEEAEKELDDVAKFVPVSIDEVVIDTTLVPEVEEVGKRVT